jgi:hypothetical protein
MKRTGTEKQRQAIKIETQKKMKRGEKRKRGTEDVSTLPYLMLTPCYLVNVVFIVDSRVNYPLIELSRFKNTFMYQ